MRYYLVHNFVNATLLCINAAIYYNGVNDNHARTGVIIDAAST